MGGDTPFTREQSNAIVQLTMELLRRAAQREIQYLRTSIQTVQKTISDLQENGSKASETIQVIRRFTTKIIQMQQRIPKLETYAVLPEEDRVGHATGDLLRRSNIRFLDQAHAILKTSSASAPASEAV